MAPVRQSPKDSSEQVTQLLLGEAIQVLSVRRNWSFVQLMWDGYRGWIDTKQWQRILPSQLDDASSLALDTWTDANSGQHAIPVPRGATLPHYDGLRFRLGDTAYQYSGQAINAREVPITRDLLIKVARRYLYAPYLWGGRSPFGIDCSGFTQMVYKYFGVRLRRDASQQVGQGTAIDFMHQAQPGDLAFFDNDKQRITHVGMVLDDGYIIHAHGWVRIDRLDHQGIYNEDSRRYTHNFRVLRRMLVIE